MGDATVFDRLLNDLEIDQQPAWVPQFVPILASDEGIDRELAEQAMAHAVGSQVEQCYARSDVLEGRREVMEAWGAFLVEQSTAQTQHGLGGGPSGRLPSRSVAVALEPSQSWRRITAPSTTMDA